MPDHADTIRDFFDLLDGDDDPEMVERLMASEAALVAMEGRERTFVAELAEARRERDMLQRSVEAYQRAETHLDEALVRAEAAEAENARLKAAIHDLVNAAERLSRPGSQADEMVNAAAMTNALMTAAKLVGNVGVFPDMRASGGSSTDGAA